MNNLKIFAKCLLNFASEITTRNMTGDCFITPVLQSQVLMIILQKTSSILFIALLLRYCTVKMFCCSSFLTDTSLNLLNKGRSLISLLRFHVSTTLPHFRVSLALLIFLGNLRHLFKSFQLVNLIHFSRPIFLFQSFNPTKKI